MSRIFLCLLAGLGVAATAAAAPPIVERAIAHHGGELYERAEIAFDVCSKSGCYDVRTRTDGGLFDHAVAGRVGEHRREVRWSNDRLEVRHDGEPVAVAPGDERVYRDWAMARIYFALLPYRLADPSVRHEDRGLVDWRGRKLHQVKVTFEPGTSTAADDEYLYWFDPETGRVEYFAYSYSGNPGGLRFRRATHHRRIGGILFFDQENLGVEGPGLSVDLIDADYVDEKMRPVSTVELKNVDVRPLR